MLIIQERVLVLNINAHLHIYTLIWLWIALEPGSMLFNTIILVLTTHATEKVIVGGWHSDISMVVAIKTHPQAKGCLQHNKLATEVDLDSTDGGDGWNNHCPIDLKKKRYLFQ